MGKDNTRDTSTDSATLVHAFRDDALGTHDAVGLHQELAAGRVSPAELVAAAIARAEHLEPQLNALVATRFEPAKRQAERTRLEHFFSGIPTLIKDNSDLAGLPTQHGSSAFVAPPASASGDFARLIEQLQLIPLGKSQLSEFGFSPAAEFTNRPDVTNPWNTAYSSGASSAGSAAMVAAGAVPLAHANDGGGSIRIPAACTGLIGLKPSRGRIPQDEAFRRLPLRIVHDGVVTRTVRDTAAFMREADKWYRNTKLAPIGDVQGPGKARLRIAMVQDSLTGPTDPEVVTVLHQAGELLDELGHHVEPIPAPVPEYFVDDFLSYWAFLATLQLRFGKRSFGPTFSRTRTDNLSQGLAAYGAKRLPRLPLSLARLAASAQVSQRFFNDYDVVMTPTLALPPPLRGWLNPGQDYDTLIDRIRQYVSFTPLQNATGDPAISLPLGESAAGIPIGLQFGAKRGAEALLLELAYELEEAAPWKTIY